MRKKMPTGLIAAALALALSLPQAGKAAAPKAAAGPSAVDPGLLTIPIPQGPPPPILNPGVTPSAPAPSTVTPNPRNSAGLSTTVAPGVATGNSGPTGRARGSRGRANRDQTRAVNEMDRELDRGLSICRCASSDCRSRQEVGVSA